MKDDFVKRRIEPVVTGLIEYLTPKLKDYIESHHFTDLSFFPQANQKWDQ